MRGRDLAVPFPAVTLGPPATEAARLLVDTELPGLVTLDTDGLLSTALSGTHVLRMAVPRYCQADPTLAQVVDGANGNQVVAVVDEGVIWDAAILDRVLAA